MKKLALFLLLLVLLAACAPTTSFYPPGTPIVYPTGYRNLFDTALQELTAAYVPDQLDRHTFSISRADPGTGLITAVRNERGRAANLNYRFPYDDDEDDDDVPFGLGFSLLVPVPVAPPEQTIITLVVRPAASGATLIYSTQGPNGTSSVDAERFMRRVISRLDARLRPAQESLESVSP
jgi:hypothetical protein